MRFHQWLQAAHSSTNSVEKLDNFLPGRKFNLFSITQGPLVLLLAMCSISTFAQSPPSAAPTSVQEQRFLTADADSKEIQVNAEQTVARFTFYVTNVSPSAIVITNLARTCGCTEATMPAQPWTLQPGDSGPINASIDLRAKSGKITKPLTIQSPSGTKVLQLIVNILPQTASSDSNSSRARNQQIAAQNRQAVFKGDCAKCHVEPTVGKLGHELYLAGCAICHDAENRAPMVPDLHALPHSLRDEEWKTWITSSKAGSMMPAFGHKEGGPLTEEQIASLVDYLSRAIKKSS